MATRMWVFYRFMSPQHETNYQLFFNKQAAPFLEKVLGVVCVVCVSVLSVMLSYIMTNKAPANMQVGQYTS